MNDAGTDLIFTCHTDFAMVAVEVCAGCGGQEPWESQWTSYATGSLSNRGVISGASPYGR